jgi:hypothetical protein
MYAVEGGELWIGGAVEAGTRRSVGGGVASKAVGKLRAVGVGWSGAATTATAMAGGAVVGVAITAGELRVEGAEGAGEGARWSAAVESEQRGERRRYGGMYTVEGDELQEVGVGRSGAATAATAMAATASGRRETNGSASDGGRARTQKGGETAEELELRKAARRRGRSLPRNDACSIDVRLRVTALRIQYYGRPKRTMYATSRASVQMEGVREGAGKVKEKVHLTSLNFHKSQLVLSRLQNQIYLQNRYQSPGLHRRT